MPVTARAVLDVLHNGGHAAYIVGGSLRDALLGRAPADWDMATDARPDRLIELFPGAVYENRFGTVAVRHDGDVFEITTFRSEHDYADFRRPHRVEFGDEIEDDLARRDFTVNAIAWGRHPAGGAPTGEANAIVDPFHGLARSRGSHVARGRQPRRTVPGGRPPDDPRRTPRRNPRVRDRARDTGRDPRQCGAGRPPVGGADRSGAREAPRRHRSRRSGCGSRSTRA